MHSEEVSKICDHHEKCGGRGIIKKKKERTQLLYHLLVPLVLLEVFDTQEVKTSFFSFIAVQLITQYAHLHFGPAYAWQYHGTAETFVLGRIITFQPNLKFDRFKESSLLAAKHLVDRFSKSFALEFATEKKVC